MIVDVYFGDAPQPTELDDATEVDVFTESGVSLFGSEHVTVAEVVHRVRSHKELVDACAFAASIFNNYASHHLSKGDSEKEKRNREYCERMRAAVEAHPLPPVRKSKAKP